MFLKTQITRGNMILKCSRHASQVVRDPPEKTDDGENTTVKNVTPDRCGEHYFGVSGTAIPLAVSCAVSCSFRFCAVVRLLFTSCRTTSTLSLTALT